MVDLGSPEGEPTDSTVSNGDDEKDPEQPESETSPPSASASWFSLLAGKSVDRMGLGWIKFM